MPIERRDLPGLAQPPGYTHLRPRGAETPAISAGRPVEGNRSVEPGLTYGRQPRFRSSGVVWQG